MHFFLIFRRIAPVKSERSFSFAQETNLSSDEDQSLSAIDNSAEASKKTKRKRDEELTQLVDFSYKNTKAGCSTNSGSGLFIF